MLHNEVNEAVNIKGTKEGLVILLNSQKTFADIKVGLHHKMESASGFFAGAGFTLYHDHQLHQDEITELENICLSHGLIKNSSLNWPPEHINFTQPEIYINDHSGEIYSMPAKAAVLVTGTMRSGELANYDGHITVLGNLHPGAKALSDGNIIILGTCSGFVHAGRSGNQEAYILAMNFKSVQLKIADTTLFMDRSESVKGPAIARIKQGQITFTNYEA